MEEVVIVSEPGALDEQVARLRADAIALVASSVAGVEAPDATRLHRELRAVADQVQMVAARLLAVVEADGRWQAGGARTFPEWIARRQGTSVGAVHRDVTLGRALESDLSATGEAVATGAITLEHAQVLASLGPTSDARRTALAGSDPDQNEASLLAAASRMGVDQYRREVRRWAVRVDAQAAEKDHDRAAAKEHLTLARRPDGVAISGFLTTEHGAALSIALRAVIGVPAADDVRSTEERNAHALTDLARLVLDRGLAGGGAQVRPHLSVHVSWEAFSALDPHAPSHPGSSRLAPAELDNGEPLTATVLARIACDSEITRVVFGPDSHVLDVGRAQRTYSGQLRRAIVARDRTCRYPGCGAPPGLGEIHHVDGWATQGPTSVINGILLCWFHHDLVHRRHLRIGRDTTGRWQFQRSDGTPIVRG